jgi:oxygen-independent coproporphyrinogen-3 oxidase
MFTRLYIHIPFCRQKCPYCAFFSQESSGSDLARYTEHLQQEMLLAAGASPRCHPLDSIYLGGGTPSLMDPSQVSDLVCQAEKLFGVAADAEVTLEANPGTIDLQKLTGFRQAGVTRLSLGIQSFDDRMLSKLGRIHTAQQAREAYAAAREAGFDNIGIDLIHALPGQTAAQWQNELKGALRLAPEHLSVYGLTIEEGTPFDVRYEKDLAASMFEAADDILSRGGYEHYEIANYARTGYRSRHNSGYWLRDGYLGLGAGAHSFLKCTRHGVRFSNVADLEDYESAVTNGSLPRMDNIPLSRSDAMAEFMFLGLRMSDGVLFSSFEREFGESIRDVFGEAVNQLLDQKLLTEDTAGIRLTRRGMLLSNSVFQRFLP